MSEKQPEISVVLPVYNDETHMAEAIKSILNQTYHNFELLIMDDASTDNSYKIAMDYAAADSRIHVFRGKENRGLPAVLNQMIHIAQGNYIARMDSDDIADANRLEVELMEMKKYQADFVFSDTRLISREGEYVCDAWRPSSTEKILASMRFHNYIPHPTVLVRREILLENPYNESYLRAQDLELWRRLIQQGNVRFHLVPCRLLSYRLNPRGKDPDFYYCNVCLANRAKRQGLRYLVRIKNKKHLFLLLIKYCLPFTILRIHGMTKTI